ncbi:MAG: hypothetical protein LBU24_00835 [Methanocalculaceae archaeon]|jgi:ABC-type transporter Mla maintaining outer membrane lipid asymmetry permease subunit MlaE|nr:hypothetical protein [Methanocalculaceae archaeon]
MSWISKGVVAAAAFYILLMVVEVACHPQVFGGVVVGAVLFGVAAGVFLSRSETKIHTVEMILIWVMILLFVVYGVLCWFEAIPWI